MAGTEFPDSWSSNLFEGGLEDIFALVFHIKLENTNCPHQKIKGKRLEGNLPCPFGTTTTIL